MGTPINVGRCVPPIRVLSPDYKQLLDEVFVISGIIKVEVSVISRSRRLRLITLTEITMYNNIIYIMYNNIIKYETNENWYH